MSVITFRSDDEVDQALTELAAGERDRSQVIRDAILAAWHTRRDERLHAEAQALAADEEDRKEARAVLSDMESLRAW